MHAVLPQFRLYGESDAPLTHQQRWVSRSTSSAHLGVAVSLDGPLDIGALQFSLNEVVRRQAALRTTFFHEGLEGKQLLAVSLDARIVFEDLSTLPLPERMEEAQ